VEVLVIGSEPGLARNLQVFYFTLGLVIAILAAALWAIEHGMGLRNVTHSRVHEGNNSHSANEFQHPKTEKSGVS
jgi:hypothetical protein